MTKAGVNYTREFKLAIVSGNDTNGNYNKDNSGSLFNQCPSVLSREAEGIFNHLPRALLWNGEISPSNSDPDIFQQH